MSEEKGSGCVEMPAENVSSDAIKYQHLYVYSGANKAGMQAVDKEKQAQIIYELSKDSAFFKRAARLDEETDRKTQAMKLVVAEVKGSLEKKMCNEVLQRSIDLERTRNFDRICCVLDMDMFYAAVEIRDQPHLRDKPVAVGGMSMISTSNYIARQFGVRAAMPGFIAKKLCPHLIFVGSNFEKYRHVSSQICDIIAQYDPNYSAYSLDEVYFDLTDAAIAIATRSYSNSIPTDMPEDQNVSSSSSSSGGSNCSNSLDMDCSIDPQSDTLNSSSGTGTRSNYLMNCSTAEQDSSIREHQYSILELRKIAAQLLHQIRRRICQATGGLTCSAGMANNFLLAKICADQNKPNGQYELEPSRHAVMDFVAGLPTRKVGGIGKVTERMLHQLLGIATMQQVRDHMPQLLHACTPTLGQFLLRTSLGIANDEGKVRAHSRSSSSSSSSSSNKNTNNKNKKQRKEKKGTADGTTITTTGTITTDRRVSLATTTTVEGMMNATISEDDQEEDGEEDGVVKEEVTRKSLGCERTYSAKGISDGKEIQIKIHQICEQVAADMQSEGLWARTVTLKLKTTTFELLTRSLSVKNYFQSLYEIERLALSILQPLLPISVRLIGVSVSKFRGARSSSSSAIDGGPSIQKCMNDYLKGSSPSMSTGNGSTSTAMEHSSRSCIINTSHRVTLQQSPTAIGKAAAVNPKQNLAKWMINSGTHSSSESKGMNAISTSGTESCMDGALGISTTAVINTVAPQSAAAAAAAAKEKYECPVCLASIQGSLGCFNAHIDRCLESTKTDSSMVDERKTKRAAVGGGRSSIATAETKRRKVSAGALHRYFHTK
mmetsp:Transcript_20594/g.35006  ORF Transcript_20594/g.35006 Transcript_20594/m.35006 type:complete len:830 (-) Transcript_20594:44-2533(-)